MRTAEQLLRAAILMMRQAVTMGERYAPAPRLAAERARLAELEAEYRRHYGHGVVTSWKEAS